MLSVSADRPLRPETLAILHSVQQATASTDVEPFVIGATARDILMQHVFGIEAGRATRDVDFALAVRGLPFSRHRSCVTNWYAT